MNEIINAILARRSVRAFQDSGFGFPLSLTEETIQPFTLSIKTASRVAVKSQFDARL